MKLMAQPFGISLPSHNPDVFFEKFLGSIEYISEIAGLAKVLMVLQSPWDDRLARKAKRGLLDNGFDSDYCFVERSDCPSMSFLRNKGVILDTSFDIYMMADHNFVFRKGNSEAYPYTSGRRYRECLDYMIRFPNCAAVMCDRFLGGSVQKMAIRPPGLNSPGLVSNRAGIFMRKPKGWIDLWPKETLSLPASLEESAVVYHIMETGRFYAKQFNNPTGHKTQGNKVCEGNVPGSVYDYEMTKQNVERYLAERYDDKKWIHDSKKFPKGLITKYILGGGNVSIFDKSNKDYEVDYTNAEI